MLDYMDCIFTYLYGYPTTTTISFHMMFIRKYFDIVLCILVPKKGHKKGHKWPFSVCVNTLIDTSARELICTAPIYYRTQQHTATYPPMITRSDEGSIDGRWELHTILDSAPITTVESHHVYYYYYLLSLLTLLLPLTTTTTILCCITYISSLQLGSFYRLLAHEQKGHWCPLLCPVRPRSNVHSTIYRLSYYFFYYYFF